MNDVGKDRFFGLFSEAIFVAALTGCAYWLSFRYEVGYLSEFGLPTYLAEVSVKRILIVAFGGSGFALVNKFLFWCSESSVGSILNLCQSRPFATGKGNPPETAGSPAITASCYEGCRVRPRV